MARSATNLHFSAIQGLYWSGFCILFTFVVPLYRDFGYSEITIGTLSMVMSLATACAQPLWGIACDRSAHLRRLFLLNILVAVPLAFGLLYSRGLPFLTGAAIFLLSSTYVSMGPMIDSWVMKLGNQGHAIHYSLTRGIGSLVYAGMAVGFGKLLDLAGLGIIPYAFLIVVGLLALVSFQTAPPGREAHHGAGGNPFASMATLVRNRRFMLLLLALVLLYTGNGAIMVFMPVRMEILGGTNATLGIAMTVMALCEVPAMLLHHRIVRYIRNDRLLALSLVFFLIKGVATAFAPSTTVLILVQVLQFASFGLFLPSAIHHINHLVDEKSLVTALMMFPSATYGVGMMLGGLAGGFLAEALGVQAMMLVLSGVTLAGIVLFAVGNRRHAAGG